LRKAFYHQS